MEGPNPASILRNSVVVACGAYMLIKLRPTLSPVVLTVLVVIGTVTAIGACDRPSTLSACPIQRVLTWGWCLSPSNAGLSSIAAAAKALCS